jgi:hypothetical protein
VPRELAGARPAVPSEMAGVPPSLVAGAGPPSLLHLRLLLGLQVASPPTASVPVNRRNQSIYHDFIRFLKKLSNI